MTAATTIAEEVIIAAEHPGDNSRLGAGGSTLAKTVEYPEGPGMIHGFFTIAPTIDGTGAGAGVRRDVARIRVGRLNPQWVAKAPGTRVED